MPTNQQRRDAAKRKLERQLARREQQERARRQRLVIIGVIAAVLVISGGIWLFVSRGDSSTASDASSTDSSESAAPTTPCSYPASGIAAKEVSAPTNLEPLNSGTVESTIVLNGQDVPVSLDRAGAPCGVNAFLSLASQGFYDNTECHRLTVSDQLKILQCGDPTGQGNGGPGYSFATEPPASGDYAVGTVALANAGADTNGSQFFIVYGPTTLSPEYTILGKVTGQGMKVVDGIAAKGVQNNAQEGPPVETATIAKVTVPADALEGTGTYVSASPSAESDVPGQEVPSVADNGAATSEPAASSPAPASSQAPASSPAQSASAATAAPSSGGAG